MSYPLVKLPHTPFVIFMAVECKHWRMGLGKQAGTKRNNANITPVALEHLHLRTSDWSIDINAGLLLADGRDASCLVSQISHSPLIAACRPRAIATIRSGTTIYIEYLLYFTNMTLSHGETKGL